MCLRAASKVPSPYTTSHKSRIYVPYESPSLSPNWTQPPGWGDHLIKMAQKLEWKSKWSWKRKGGTDSEWRKVDYPAPTFPRCTLLTPAPASTNICHRISISIMGKGFFKSIAGVQNCSDQWAWKTSWLQYVSWSLYWQWSRSVQKWSCLRIAFLEVIWKCRFLTHCHRIYFESRLTSWITYVGAHPRL